MNAIGDGQQLLAYINGLEFRNDVEKKKYIRPNHVLLYAMC